MSWRATATREAAGAYAVFAALLAGGSSLDAAAQSLRIAAGESATWAEVTPFDTLVVAGALTIAPPPGAAAAEIAGYVHVLPGARLTSRHVDFGAGPGGSALAVEPGAVAVLRDCRFARSGPGAESAGASVAPLVDLRCADAAVDRCSFAGPGPLLSVSGSGSSVRNTEFVTPAGIALALAPAGLGRDIEVRDCRFLLGPSAIGISARSPLVAVVDCEVVAAGDATGVDVGPLAAYRDFAWPTAAGENGLRGLSLRHSGAPGGVGVRVRSFGKSTEFPLSELSVDGYAVGVDLSGAPLSLAGGELSGNALGVRLDAAAALARSSVVGGDTGVAFVGSAGGNTLTDVTIAGATRGVHVEALSGGRIGFTKVGIEETRQRLSFAPGTTGALYADTAIAAAMSSTVSSAHGHHAQDADGGHDHHARHTTAPSYAVVLVPRDDVRAGEHCRDATDDGDWVECPLESVGLLTVATGHGLPDPIHEHDSPLGTVRFESPAEYAVTAARADAQTATFELAGDRTYALSVGGIGGYRDLYLGWESTARVRFRIAYPHAPPVAIRALGEVLPEQSTREALARARETSYYVDSAAGVVEVVAVPTAGPEEVILYTRSAPTPLRAGDRFIELHQPSSAGAEAHVVKLEPGTARVTLTDMFGVAIAPPAEVDAEGHAFDLSAYRGHGGWVFVETDEGYFKGPLLHDPRRGNTTEDPVELPPSPPAKSDHSNHHGHH